MKIYFKIKAILDPSSINDLSYLDTEEVLKVYSKLTEFEHDVILTCSLGLDDKIHIHNIDDRPVVDNVILDTYGGCVTDESKFQ